MSAFIPLAFAKFSSKVTAKILLYSNINIKNIITAQIMQSLTSVALRVSIDVEPKSVLQTSQKDIEDNIRELKLFLTLFCLPCDHKLIFGAEKNFISEI